MPKQVQRQHAGDEGSTAATAARSPGRTTLAATQAARPAPRPRTGEPDTFEQLAAGSAGAVPYAETLQPRFGDRLDLSSVRAHVGAGGELRQHGAEAAAWDGGHVAFADAQPDLDTVAEEMVHIYQQRNNGGAGEGPRISHPGDRAEQEARAAGELIARGESMPDITAPAVSEKRTEPARLSMSADDVIVVPAAPAAPAPAAVAPAPIADAVEAPAPTAAALPPPPAATGPAAPAAPVVAPAREPAPAAPVVPPAREPAPAPQLTGLALDELPAAAAQAQASLDRIFDGQREQLAAPRTVPVPALPALAATPAAPPAPAAPIAAPPARRSDIRHDPATDPQRNAGDEQAKAARAEDSAGPRPRVELDGPISVARPDGKAAQTERAAATTAATFSARALAGGESPAAQLAPPPPAVQSPAVAVPPAPPPPPAPPAPSGPRPATLDQAALSASLDAELATVAATAAEHDRAFAGRMQALDTERATQAGQVMATAQAEQAAVLGASTARAAATRQQWQAENTRVRDQRVGQVQAAHATTIATAGTAVQTGEQSVAADLSRTEAQAGGARSEADARAAALFADAQGRASAARGRGTVMRRDDDSDAAPAATSDAEAEAILDAAEAEMQAVLAEADRLVAEMLAAAEDRSFAEVAAIRAQIDALFAGLDAELAAALALVETELPDVAARFESTLAAVSAEAQASVGAIHAAAVTACATGHLGTAEALAATFADDIAAHHVTVSTEFRNALQHHQLIYGDGDRVLGPGGFDYFGAELVDPALAGDLDGDLGQTIHDQVYADNLPANFDELSPQAQAWALQAAEDAARLASDRYTALAAGAEDTLSPEEQIALQHMPEADRQRYLQGRALHNLNVGQTGGVGEVDLNAMTEFELYNYNHELVNRAGGDFRTEENAINIIGMRGVQDGRVHDNSGETYNDTAFVVRLVAGPDGRMIPDVHEGPITTDYGNPDALEEAGYGRDENGERHFGLLAEGSHALYINEVGTLNADGDPYLPNAYYTPGQHPLKGDARGLAIPSVLDADGDRLIDEGETGVIGMGTNLHGGGPADQEIGTWSANCQVIPTRPEGDTSTDVMYYPEFMDLLMQDPAWLEVAAAEGALNYSADHPIPYTLVEGQNLP